MPLPIILIGEDSKADNPLREIVQEAMGVPLILDSAPTTANGLLPEGRWGLNGSSLYITIAGTTYEWALVGV